MRGLGALRHLNCSTGWIPYQREGYVRSLVTESTQTKAVMAVKPHAHNAGCVRCCQVAN